MVKKVIRESLRPFKDLFGSGSGAPELPVEDPSIRILRERQVSELASLDEEENRRLKTAFRASRGIRAFRRSGASGSTRSSAGSTGQRAFTGFPSVGGGVAP